ncbi:MAG: polysaccharide biosynthesis/export family protein [Candidatus Binatia bacterium]
MRRTSNLVRLAIVAALAVELAGCASSVSVPLLTREEAVTFRAAGNYLDANYRLETGDSLKITFPFHAEMDRQETIRPDGRITVPAIGEVVAYGSTTTALETTLAQRSSSFLKNPEVHVTVVAFAEKTIFVTGEVRRPGMLPYRANLTPLQAVVEAGGLLESAHVENVVLIRSAGPNDQFVSRRLNLQETITAGADQPLELAPRDVLYVPRTAIAEADLWIDQHVTRLFPFIRGAGASFPLF